MKLTNIDSQVLDVPLPISHSEHDAAGDFLQSHFELQWLTTRSCRGWISNTEDAEPPTRGAGARANSGRLGSNECV